MSDAKITLDFAKTKIKVDERSRDRMKITIKLNKQEAESFKNMKKVLVPEDAQDDVFLKSIFFMGLEQFHNNAIAMMKKYVNENEDKLREEGFDVDSFKNLREDSEVPTETDQE
jgi:hypothetical protein